MLSCTKCCQTGGYAALVQVPCCSTHVKAVNQLSALSCRTMTPSACLLDVAVGVQLCTSIAVPKRLMTGFVQGYDGPQRAWDVEVIIVRTAERLLDVAAGVHCVDFKLEAVHEPSASQACQALRNLAPALAHLHGRATSRQVHTYPAILWSKAVQGIPKLSSALHRPAQASRRAGASPGTSAWPCHAQASGFCFQFPA